ncbi:MAG TPA: hypothetical protein PLA68_12800 [Panacibacter sp.]|nr:hypothetical protein [Panacibacter sp.]
MTSASSFINGKKTFKSNEQRIEIIFNHHLIFNDLVKIKLDVSEQGIVLNYKKLGFDDNGKLISIDFFVDCKDGFSGNASSDKVTDRSHFGFYRDYTKNSKFPFGTGAF